MDIDVLGLGSGWESGMMKHGAIGQRTAAAVGWIFVSGFPRARLFAGCLVIGICGSSRLTGAQKNRLRLLRSGADGLV